MFNLPSDVSSPIFWTYVVNDLCQCSHSLLASLLWGSAANTFGRRALISILLVSNQWIKMQWYYQSEHSFGKVYSTENAVKRNKRSTDKYHQTHGVKSTAYLATIPTSTTGPNIFLFIWCLSMALFNYSGLAAPRLSFVQCLVSFDLVCFVLWMCFLESFCIQCAW